MFVPGNVGALLRVGAGFVNVTKAMDEYTGGAILHQSGLASQAPSAMGVVLAAGGTLIDAQQMAKGVFKVLGKEASAASHAGSQATTPAESAAVREAEETVARTGTEAAEKTVHAVPPPAPPVRNVYVEGELRPATGTPEVARGPRTGVEPEYSAAPLPARRPQVAGETPPRRSTSEEIAETLKEKTEYPGRSLTDTAGHTAGESARLAEEIAGSLGGRLDRLEQHHSVFVFVLRAIQARRAGRAARTVTSKGGEGFRQIVDDMFPQKLVGMERMAHDDVHRALNDVLDEMLEPQRVVDLIERRGLPETFGQGFRVVERGGARDMMQRLQYVTELELVDIVEQAYRRVFIEHPGLVSTETMQETLQAIDSVRRALQ
jgi:hypothetical protein